MSIRIGFLLLIAGFGLSSVAFSQGVDFSFTAIEDGFDAAREQEKLVIVYYYADDELGTAAYAHIWEDPLVTRFANDLAVPVAINENSEEGDAFAKQLRKRRKKSERTAPGIYFFSDRGRSLGALHGDLSGEEGVGRFLMMLGAAEYALDQKEDRRPRYYHPRRWYW